MLSTAMMLEVVGRQLEAWEMPLESSWRCLDASKASSGELLKRLGGSRASSGERLKAARRLPELLESPGGGPGGVLGGPGGV